MWGGKGADNLRLGTLSFVGDGSQPENFVMRLPVVLAVAVTAVTVASALHRPAAAMELREAIKRCDASPGCTYTLDKSGATIFGPKGGVVSCPPKQGDCAVIGKTKGGKPGPKTVTGVLKGQEKPVKVTGGTPSKTASGTKVNRDHRGDTTTAVKVKFSGARNGRDPGWGTYGNGKGSGPTVRDHRH
jgi:hypothetical protein